METITNIETTIQLHPSDILANYQTILLNKIVEKFEKKSFEQNGIIIKVLKILECKSLPITENSIYLQFLITFEAQVYKPLVDNEMEIQIHKIYSYGVFYFDEQIRVLIPSSSLQDDYCLEKKEDVFILKNEKNETIQEGDDIKIILTNVRFEKNGFNCLGKIK